MKTTFMKSKHLLCTIYLFFLFLYISLFSLFAIYPFEWQVWQGGIDMLCVGFTLFFSFAFLFFSFCINAMQVL